MMHDFLKGIIETAEKEFGPLPKLTSEQLKQAAHEIVEKAKATRPVVTSCPHLETLYKMDEGDFWHCGVCGQIVHPDPEALKHGYREFGRKI